MLQFLVGSASQELGFAGNSSVSVITHSQSVSAFLRAVIPFKTVL